MKMETETATGTKVEKVETPESKEKVETKPDGKEKDVKGEGAKGREKGAKVAVVLIRGLIKSNKKIKETLKSLKLPRKNSCVVVDGGSVATGMISKVKDYVTWGEIDKETFALLLGKRGKLARNVALSEDYLREKTGLGLGEFVEKFFAGEKKIQDVPGLKRFFRLKPPKGGFERGGVKKPFSMGGVLGYRKDEINGLIKRML